MTDPPTAPFARQAILALSDQTLYAHEVLIRPPGLGAEQFMRTLTDAPAFEARQFTHVMDQLRQVSPEKISYNVSSAALPHVPRWIDRACERGLNPHQLILELTSEPVDQPAIQAIRERGCKVALDDFFREPFAYHHLIDTALDVIKLDRHALYVTHASGRRALKNLMAVCADHGIAVVAEGIETEAQLAFARDELGVQYGQGWLLGREELFPPAAAPEQERTEHVVR
ncbi:EAL domain-containing protein [Deinococcus soli (ex Cha et al. 2016)]|uniref:EAL domain-containing protein (Putative c-di-GMP-specific phosphodiesterase class I) n=2 Tax=Deinococcus soli (ex Cha et al. 2016) TaxID=1309411 RepID=A0AAE3XD69_9DEIO|nr:EAL domain-containing protein [Deinococcus soli (ex Cha et al. 2016)]MDR6218499.1 EAL domain-containing protein (putative c-di-GMP-specific phosphodiesterase class I) [Deinococcus soli (ex Cha et al. 2016)]MDR6329239.1 EAL domain-containing protein (putative c-di-GMP-specific phosphodiesterase class I) [Deinococcus soli (ex Cha et al. 2016)]MDR6751512.1 EAL domain-containing protein (putative c-di-GMP-specific phosphodiesterase class I) [Deinococcus soli (ex Cha et al. 2016)]